MAAVLISAVPLLWPAVPPLTDLPGHLGRFRVMLDGDAGPLAAWYRFRWMLVGNLGVDLAVRALAPVLGLLPAVKAVVIATVMLTVAGTLWIAREVHGRVTPWAIAALPLAYNYAFHFGFVNYLLAMALALNAFALWLRLGQLARYRLRAALFVPVALAIWLAHVVGWGMLGLFVLGAELRDWKRVPLRLLPLAPDTGFVVVDGARAHVTVDGELLTRHRIEGEARADFGHTASALGDHDEVHDHDHAEDHEADHH